MFKLSSIKVGMNYQDIRNEITKSDNLVMSCLPDFCKSDYILVEDLDTKEKVYVLRDYDTGIITDVTTDCSKAQIVNLGKRCTGIGNIGNDNDGDYNKGNGNTGNWNTGDNNNGDKNTGNINTGDCNAGDGNEGICNTGDWNIGDRNTGSGNNGDHNTGNSNDGNCNTGNHNAGNGNVGDWNLSSYNVGCFNVKEHKIMLFDEQSDMTYREWLESDARNLLYYQMPDAIACRQQWWDGLPNQEKNVIKAIPNFDADIFYKCTGIRVQ